MASSVAYSFLICSATALGQHIRHCIAKNGHIESIKSYLLQPVHQRRCVFQDGRICVVEALSQYLIHDPVLACDWSAVLMPDYCLLVLGRTPVCDDGLDRLQLSSSGRRLVEVDVGLLEGLWYVVRHDEDAAKCLVFRSRMLRSSAGSAAKMRR